MSKILDEKLEIMEKMQDKQSWYIVKHNADFMMLGYLCSILVRYQENPVGNLIQYVEQETNKLLIEKNIKITSNYRTLRVAVFFGLLKMSSGPKYEEASVTDTYREILSRTNGNFEKTHLYQDIIDRQIEKIYISSSIDQESKGVRSKFNIFPTVFLYKVLIEIGTITNNFNVTLNEFKYIISLATDYEDYLKVVYEILEIRRSPDYLEKFSKYGSKFDNRLHLAIGLISHIDIDGALISLKESEIDVVRKKIFSFEVNKYKYNESNYIDFLCSTQSITYMNEIKPKNIVSSDDRLKGGQNIIFYGVPGSGKSYYINSKYTNDPNYYERVVFHPEYSNTDLIGQILPSMIGDDISYKFIPGPLTKLLKKAYEDPQKMYYLFIEELNRGNAAAIFGELFQLLDRNVDGESEYGISNQDISMYVYKTNDNKIFLPSNLSILSTLNTSDQNVFVIDTAFQRRWEMKLVKNNIEESLLSNINICNSSVTWSSFATSVNRIILNNNSSMLSYEDKQLGAYFVTEKELKDKTSFSEKVLKYLWDDAFKFSRNIIFKDEYKSFEELIVDFQNASGEDIWNILSEDFFNSVLGVD